MFDDLRGMRIEMNRYRLFREYNNVRLWGIDLADALLRQKVLKTYKGARLKSDGQNVREIMEYGGEELSIKIVHDVLENPHSKRGDIPYITAVVELEDGKIIEIDAAEENTIGRPPIGENPMKLFSLYLTDDQIAWAKSQPGGAGEAIRKLIQNAIE